MRGIVEKMGSVDVDGHSYTSVTPLSFSVILGLKLRQYYDSDVTYVM